MLRNDRGLRLVVLIGTLLGVLVILGGCPNPKVGFDSPAPNKRVDAIVRAADQTDPESRIMLVKKLGSTDSVERMMAIRALEKREGETFGYDHAAPYSERLEAIERWRAYVGLSDDTEDGEDSPMNSQPEDAGTSNDDG